MSIGLLRLARPANLPTAAADIMAGTAVSTYTVLGTTTAWGPSLPWAPMGVLMLASVCLYAGGVVLNDVFDYEVDRRERPERPLPSGMVPRRTAAVFGGVLLLLGILIAGCLGKFQGSVAMALAVMILIYDAWAKNHSFLGPLTMGLCRGLNLMLGMLVFASAPYPWPALIPVIYIFAVTMISRGEVHGNNKKHLILAAVLYGLVIIGVAWQVFLFGAHPWSAALVLAIFALVVYRPLQMAYRNNTPEEIKKAVIAGVMALVILDAAWAAGFIDLFFGILVLCLLPVSMILARLFAVT